MGSTTRSTTSRSYPDDQAKVELAIELSRCNIEERSGGPFGAVVFGPDDRVIAIGVNRVLPHSCSLAHAEIMAYMLAQQRQPSARASTARSRRTDRADHVGNLLAALLPVLRRDGLGRHRPAVDRRAQRDVEDLTEFDEGPLPADWIGELERRGIAVTLDVQRDAARAVLRAYGESGGDRY
jgi:hypothetical protein